MRTTKIRGLIMQLGPIVSVFDFDGTLFRSPAPSVTAERRYPAIAQPYSNKGLGWFHNRRSLEEPYVPSQIQSLETSSVAIGTSRGVSPSAANDECAAEGRGDDGLDQQSFDACSVSFVCPSSFPHDAFDRWFIAPTVQRYIEAKARGDVTAILTGREASFTTRITEIVESAGLSFDHLHLKTHPGTVRFKVDVLVQMLRTYTPKALIYYEDRPDQASKIMKGLLKAIEGAFDDEQDMLKRHYLTPGVVKIIMVDKTKWHGDTHLDSALEEKLIADLLDDSPHKRGR